LYFTTLYVRREKHFGAVTQEQRVHGASGRERIFRDLPFISCICAGLPARGGCASASEAEPMIIALSRAHFNRGANSSIVSFSIIINVQARRGQQKSGAGVAAS
jgi:hypothetical protein